MTPFTKFKDIVSSYDNFLLICHERPDGDSIGALLAMGEILSSLGKKFLSVSRDEVPQVFRFLKGSGQIKKDFLLGDFEAVILLDNGDFKRTGFADRLISLKKKKVPIVNIDHHVKSDLWKVASLNCVKTEASSTCEIIYDIITVLGVEITPSIATALLAGIFNDTGGFRHSNTRPRVLEISSCLLNKGAKLKEISKNMANSRSVAMLKLWGIALSRLLFNPTLDLVYSVITWDDLQKAGAGEEDASGLVNLINSIPGAKFALLLYETADGKIKGSFRTELDGLDLAKLANFFGGGGHKKAAGFSITGKLKQTGGRWQVV